MTSAVATIIYGIFALGGVALYLAMPRPTGTHRKAGAAIGFCAIVGLVALLASESLGLHVGNRLFYFFAAVALFAAGRVVTHPIPTYSAVYFALVVLCVAVLLVIQLAEFLAVALIIIYAGAILVTYAFVIMLAQQSGAQVADFKAREPLLAILASFVLMGTLAGRMGEMQSAEILGEGVVSASVNEAAPMDSGNTIEIGRSMFGSYVVAVQLGGLLLLIAMVGAIAIARKRVPIEEIGPPPPPIGTIGREVPPF